MTTLLGTSSTPLASVEKCAKTLDTSNTITVNGEREGENNITIYYMGGWRVQNGQNSSYVINGRPQIAGTIF